MHVDMLWNFFLQMPAPVVNVEMNFCVVFNGSLQKSKNEVFNGSVTVVFSSRQGAENFMTLENVKYMDNTVIRMWQSPTAQKLAEQANKVVSTETGWDRLKSIFRTEYHSNLANIEFNAISPELDGVLSAASVGTLIGFFIGALPASRAEYEDFITNNKATKFQSHFEAKTKLQHNVTQAMAIAGWRVAWRLGLFTGAYMFFTTAVSVYRNKTSVYEFAAGGLLAGSMYKLPMGPKAMCSGGLAGAALGTLAGGISVGIMKLTGTTTEDIRYWKKGWREAEMREITSITNPNRAKAAGHLAVAHEIEMARRAGLLDMANEEESGAPGKDVQETEGEKEKTTKNESPNNTSETLPR
uniref:Complex I assembly factor TIMMDC1, mitochondrial n=1 Tax=Ceriodaphnia reticulata TaxID=302197 RepID=A0A4Y7M0N5_9CRUS|nr:EOG090X0FS6 [Ceriodaphnia reticulata]